MNLIKSCHSLSIYYYLRFFGQSFTFIFILLVFSISKVIKLDVMVVISHKDLIGPTKRTVMERKVITSERMVNPTFNNYAQFLNSPDIDVTLSRQHYEGIRKLFIYYTTSCPRFYRQRQSSAFSSFL